MNQQTSDVERWRRTRWGNLTKETLGLRLTVFPSGGRFKHCIASAMGPSYSRQAWPTEKAAIRAVEKEVQEIFGDVAWWDDRDR